MSIGAGTTHRPIRALVVDDEPDFLDVLTLELEQLGFAVVGASSGAAALEAARRERFDVVLTDFKMPAMDGLELAARLRAIDPELRVVLATGCVSDEVTIRSDVVVDAHLCKPFGLRDAATTLMRVVERPVGAPRAAAARAPRS